MSHAAGAERYHSLDALRGAMMLLGLVLHAAMAYLVTPNPIWPVKDASTSYAFDLLVVVIHTFRMPVFFVMAGFFAALLYERRGLPAFLGNRSRRVLLPLLLAWPLLYPINWAAFNWLEHREVGPALWIGVRSMLTGRLDWGFELQHLWFLYYLVLFYAATAVLLWGWERAGKPSWPGLPGGFTRLLESPARAVWMSLPLLPLLVTMDRTILETHATLLPAPKILLAYGLFFGFGWLLYGGRGSLPKLRHGVGRSLVVTLVPLFGLLGGVHYLQTRGASPGPVLAGAACSALVTWMAIFGMMGLFLRWCERPSGTWRYLADASYWLYLVHLPFTLWVPVFLLPLPWPAAAKFSVTLAATFAAGLLSYDLFVRSTAMGALLSGRRYPRVLTAFLFRGTAGARKSAAETG